MKRRLPRYAYVLIAIGGLAAGVAGALGDNAKEHGTPWGVAFGGVVAAWVVIWLVVVGLVALAARRGGRR
ncbi:hypothetical protein [Curtobacterium sp. MCBD17_003]|uniref:hypothetical protein n=1 Tax=Curtobacterium sp. MCBD17_003 TaxID=2175667 RepID=UPI0011B713C1|nr:hypothetical protein [Curtobacterium sp. MCBD17_003]WIE53433.1 hypothetical protein DEI88_009695 [Curtobacterium sp. MCBD17_003]